MMELTDWIETIFFARHETFPPRYGWLKKGYDAVVEHGPDVFDSANAIEYLGVGKNMVRAVRFWAMAYKILEPVGDKKTLRIGGQMQATDLGNQLFNDQTGWDPYLEDISSLWLLHWQLCMPPILATAWPLILNLSLSGKFTSKDLATAVTDRMSQHYKSKHVALASIEKDASCFIRMYGSSKSQNSDEIECPFTQLGLLSSDGDRQAFSFNIDEKNTLPNPIFLAACFQYAAHTQPALRTLSLHKLVYGFNSPGVLFRISETGAGRRLDEGVMTIPGVAFIESYGNRQLQFEQEPDRIAQQLLSQYYTQNN